MEKVEALLTFIRFQYVMVVLKGAQFHDFEVEDVELNPCVDNHLLSDLCCVIVDHVSKRLSLARYRVIVLSELLS